MKIAAAYVRVSTDDQLEYSPDSQLQAIRDYAKSHDLILAEEYIFREEDGRSGRQAEKRPEFMRMISTAKQQPPPFEVILCWKYSRFARNQEESIVYKSMLKKDGIEVVSISEPLIDGPFGSLIERIIEWMDEYYSIRLSGEVKRGMTEKVSRGEPVTIPPLGYLMENKQLVPDPEMAPVISMLFDEFAAGTPMLQLARRLNGMGIRTRRGCKIEYRTLNYIMQNPVYIGKIRWTPTGRANRYYKTDDTLIVDGNHQPIITTEQWEKAQAKIAENKQKFPRYQRNTASKFMLRGLVHCSNCGATLVTSTPGSLQCNHYAKGLCSISHSITITKLDKAVMQGLEHDALDMGGNLKIEYRTQSAPIATATIKAQIKKEQNKLQRCKEAYQGGVDTLAEYRSNKEAILSTIADLEKQLITAPTAIPAPDPQALRDKIIAAIPTLKDPDVTPTVKNNLLRCFISKIVYTKSNEEIEMYYYM